MKHVVINTYSNYNARRFGTPWVAPVKPDATIDFSRKIGGYTGGYKTGDAGDLYVTDPVDGTIYAYGQKDYRGRYSGYEYAQYIDGEFKKVARKDLLKALDPMQKQ